MMTPRLLRGFTVALAALILTACTSAAPAPVAPPPAEEPASATPSAPRPLTVATTESYATSDPAAAVTAMSSSLTLNVFQRLMTAPSGESVLKPDAARDCIVRTPKRYVCTLNEGLTFHNGHRLTASDVKFSIERARRLNIAETSTPLFSSIEKIETPDPLTVIFELNRIDREIGFALASPAASIVDEQLYPPDKLQPREQGLVGSGPFLVGSLDGAEVVFTRFGRYKGPNPSGQPTVILHRFANSGEVEGAMADGSVDAVWRGLSTSALIRLGDQESADPSGRTEAGFTSQGLTGARVTRLLWAPKSEHRTNADLRGVITGALEPERTLVSILPVGVEGHLPTFAIGGPGGVNVTWPEPIPLVLSYDPQSPDTVDVANQIKTRIEATNGVRIDLDPGNGDADLVLTDRPAWTWTALAWAQPYTQHPAIGSVVRVEELVRQYSTAIDPPEREVTLGELQKQAAADQVVLPISQTDERVFLADGVTITPNGFGPSWQLGLWGFNR